jgi:hypothetical protein
MSGMDYYDRAAADWRCRRCGLCTDHCQCKPERPATVTTTWELWEYDVWGSPEEGYDVNDRQCFDRAYTLALTVEVNNPGTPQEFLSATPTDEQIREAFGIPFAGRDSGIDTDGDDMTIYVTRERDGYPIGEMHCTSHASLSPIRELDDRG